MRCGVSSKYGPTRGLLSKTLFVSDLDGTLLSSGKELLDGQTATLNHLIDRGLQFTVATARSIQAVNALLKDVHLYLPAIALGGSLVTRPDSREHLLARALSQQTSEELLSRLYHRDILPFGAAIDDHRDWGFYSHTTSAAAQWYVDEKRAYGDPRLCWYNHPADELGTNVLSITAFVEQGEVNELTNDLMQVESARVNVIPIRHFPGWYEVTASHPKADKGEAVNSLRRLWNTRWDRVVVFGDDINDLPLLETADYAIAVQNSTPEALAKADQVIQSNDSGSVIDYLARYPFDWRGPLTLSRPKTDAPKSHFSATHTV